MPLDRRALLIGLAGGAAALSFPARAGTEFQPECFAASRKDDRGNFQAAIFTLDGDEQAVELPGRGHDIALRPGGGEWVAFARRPGRFGVAVSLKGRSADLVRDATGASLLRPRRLLLPTANCSTRRRTTTNAHQA